MSIFDYLAPHPVVAGDGVLHAVGERVPEVELPGDIGRRDDHHEHLLRLHILQTILTTILWLEKALFLPPGVPGSLYILGTVCIREGTCGVFSFPGLGSPLVLCCLLDLLRLLLGLLLFFVIIRFLLCLYNIIPLMVQ